MNVVADTSKIFEHFRRLCACRGPFSGLQRRFRIAGVDRLVMVTPTPNGEINPLVLTGDFNIAPEDRDVYDPVAWAGQIHCTPEERAQARKALGGLLAMLDRRYRVKARASSAAQTPAGTQHA